MPMVEDALSTDKAKRTDKWTEILFRAPSNRAAERWRFVSFRGAKGGEWCGIVDIIAIRKDTTKSYDEVLRMGDLFGIILVQLKGGLADMPTHKDIQRLKAVAARYNAKEVVLFEWRQEPKRKRPAVFQCSRATIGKNQQQKTFSERLPTGTKQKGKHVRPLHSYVRIQ